ncbi:hypothetical protein PVAR5_3053 [Paecilomyces variotii No. 5]|uniref:Uncharacterized protein n=1 Tax=Byssochlamys spectabilis (strain No. 5 / NBRC 109023) TaxID=1356009 RepID=V5G0Q2_BYSSN|nr:hypothetical protein PVAR5_3053 [Paecilomyces variotii No. 5]
MMEILSRNLPRRLFLLVSLAIFFIALISSLGRIEEAEQNGILEIRDLNSNLTVDPKVLIDWDTFVSRGNALSCAMRATEQDAAQYLRPGIPVNSEFVDYGDLTAWGWEVNPAPHALNGVQYALRVAFSALNINMANDAFYHIRHTKPVNVDGEEYEV